jgi:hypothetical protein
VFAVSIISGASVFAYWLSLRAKRQGRSEALLARNAIRDELTTLRAELESQLVALEERVDFAERILANQRQLPQIEGGDDRST